VIGVALDMDNGKIWFSKNGVFQASGDPVAGTNAAFTNLGGNLVAPWMADDASNELKNFNMNFGQRPFEKWNGSAFVANTAPSGFKALCTQNLPPVTIGATSTTQANKYIDVTLYTGNNTAGRNITNSGSFQPDFVWIKNRSGANNHILTDAVRGATKTLFSDSTSAEVTVAGALTAFNSNGFQVGYDGTAIVNASANNYVGWQWNAGGSNATNTSGSITSTVRANTTSGFSIVTYTGTGANATVGHGLGVAPSMMLVKSRSATFTWRVYHVSIGNGNVLYLSATDASTAESTAWNSTTPTSSVFSVGTGNGTNASAGTYVAYCFAPVAGYSAFGRYTGNNSADGPFVYTGFRPRYVLIKEITSGSTAWLVVDSARNTYNVVNSPLFPNNSGAESSATYMDFTSNGFKIRNTFSDLNGTTSQNYIYAAFAEAPFKYSLAR